MNAVLPVLKEDYHNLSQFLADFQDETRGPQFWLNRFEFWWDNNPAFSGEGTRGWLDKEGDKIVGFLGNFPTYFQLAGEPIIAFNATTWRVLPEYRNRSMNLFLKLSMAAKDSILFDTTPTQEVAKILEVFKYRPLPREDYRRSFIVTDFAKFKRALKLELGGKFIHSLTAEAMAMVQPWQYLRLKRIKPHDTLQVRESHKADETFDDLWDRTKAIYSHTNVRSAEAVNWYCFGEKNQPKKLFGCYQNRQLAGFMILKILEGRKIRKFEALDIWTDPTVAGVLDALLDFAVQYAKQHDIGLLILPHFNIELGKRIRQFAFPDRNAAPRQEYFKYNPKRNLEFNSGNSYFVSFQGDLGFI
ncbi:MAG: hypothetical protein HUU32_15930 [Calditrichaceae bacterium]|nr:hypothetical protein [Calditrichia bacterium]NUQ42877.1 hypothetical protein [Calditrichaceae bacterium]